MSRSLLEQISERVDSETLDLVHKLIESRQEVAPVGEVIVSKVGDYFEVQGEMACVIWDYKKIAECYSDEDAEFVGAAIRAYTSTGQTSDARAALAYADPKELSEYLGGTGGPFLRIGPQNAIRCVPLYSREPE